MPATEPRCLREEIFNNHYKANGRSKKPLQKFVLIFSNSPRGRLGNSPRSTGRSRSTGWAPLCYRLSPSVALK